MIVTLKIALLVGLTALASTACFGWVVYRMFREGERGVAVASLALLPVAGAGQMVAFVYG
jgi:hypothetical protein